MAIGVNGGQAFLIVVIEDNYFFFFWHGFHGLHGFWFGGIQLRPFGYMPRHLKSAAWGQASLVVVVWWQGYTPKARARAWRALLSPCTSRISPGGAGMDFTQLTSMF